MNIPIQTILELSIGLIMTGFAISIYHLSDRSKALNVFIFFCGMISLWGFSMGTTDILSISSFSNITISYSIKASYIFGTLIASTFLLFTILYPKEPINRKTLWLIVICEVVITYLILFTQLIITNTVVISDLAHLSWGYGIIWFIFDIYFYLCWLLGILIIYGKLKSSKNKSDRKILKSLLVSFIIGIIPPIITGIILPKIGIFDYAWVNSISQLFWIIIITYSITRHHLFNIKIITIELVTFVLWIFMLIRTLLAKDVHEMILDGTFFIVTIVFGIMLIKGVMREIEHREKIVAMADELQDAYRKLGNINPRDMQNK